MSVIDSYCGLLNKTIPKNPKRAKAMINLGLAEECFRLKHFPNKAVPQGLNLLNHYTMRCTANALKHPEQSAWVNLFSPVELLQCFGLNCNSIELISSFLSGFHCEATLIDTAESAGIASTLCSYHKNFIGASLSGILPTPRIAVTTSMICDGNFNTFRYLSQQTGVPTYYLDIPHSHTPESEQYVLDQLWDLAHMLERTSGKKFHEDDLSEMLACENESKRLYEKFSKLQTERLYPSTMTLNMFLLHITHLSIGLPATLDIFKALRADIESYPEYHGQKLFWIHLFPYYQETLKQYLNLSKEHYICGYDLNHDFTDYLDPTNPMLSLAKKLLSNRYNTDYAQRAQWLTKMIQDSGADGAIHFCHWGCKQVSGGVQLLKQSLREQKIPLLILDGDALDRRNSHDGQLKTRLEAFMELLNKGEYQE